MKKVLCLFILMCLILVSGNIFSEKIVRVTAAVAEFQPSNTVSENLAATITEYFRTHLFGKDKYILVTRENMEEILKEQDFQVSGCMSDQCVVEMGKVLGVSKVFTGTLGTVGSIYLLSIKILDVETGQIEMAKSQKANKEEDLLGAVERLVMNMLNITPSQRRRIPNSSTVVREGLVYCTDEINPYTGVLTF